MADSASRSSSPRGRPSIPRPLTPTDDDVDDDDDASSLSDSPQANPSRQLEAFSRKVTATAGQLIGSSLGDGGVSKHYQNALGELHKELRRPIIQRSVFSFAQTTPRDIVRSNLSVPEIQHRALSYLPDGLLVNIPEDKNVFSLFEGFQASVPSDGQMEGKPHGTNLRGQRLLGDIEEEEHNSTSSSLVGLKNEMNRMRHRLEMMSVRKHMCMAEIREIDNKIANLNTMRKIVLDRLANLEGEESDLEHDLLDMENKIEDLEEELEDEAALAQGPGPISNDEDQSQNNEEFMSKSIYEKISSPKTKSRKSMRRTTPAPVQMEEMESGSKYREIQAHNDLITALDFDAPFGTLVTAAVDDTVRVWDMNAGRCIGLLEGHLTSVRCLQVEGNIVATGAMDASIRLWDLSRADYAPLDMDVDNELEDDDGLTFENPEDAPPPPPPSIMQDCPLFTLEAHVDEITALHFKGDMLVSGSSDKTLRQWDLVKGRCVQTLDVLWAAAQASATIDSTRSGPWRQNGRAPDASADFVGALQCFDAALACGTADGMVRLWDLRSGQVHRSLVGHTGPVTALQFDDVHLVTSSMDRSIRIWDLRTGSIYDAYAYDNPVTSMMFDPRRIVSAAGEDVVKVYDKTDGRHWNCGLGVGAEEGDLTNVSTVERVRIKDGYLVEGRRNGFVGIWSC